ncbi:MAG: flagellar basal body P-ring protein FlgI [Phycisphaerales bacterium]|nr:flagellar basal body P-ring protein FlgI [Phycisphaerales bacterium]
MIRLTLVVLLVATLGGCSSKSKTRARTVETPVVKDVPVALRGTIGAEATVRGDELTHVSGYGLVVGLNGTGGLPLNDRIAQTMERELGLRGISVANDSRTPFAGMSPREVLRDPAVAVVRVDAAVPIGAPAGATFDTYVTAMNATSLEGGRLWTTELRVGEPSVFGGYQTHRVAESRGQIFINPFSEPGREQDGVNRTVGRILSGGVVTQPMEMALFLDNPSHSRARAITSAINSRFPEQSGDRGPVARGKSDGLVAITVPESYRERSDEFVALLTHIRVDQAYPEEAARRFVEAMKAEPGLANELSLCLEAVGFRAIPFVREAYDYPELAVRMGALRAGAKLGDVLAAPYLKEIARTGNGLLRTDAIALLGGIDAGPQIDQALRELLDVEELTVRIAAYEALADRARRAQLRKLIEVAQHRGPTERPLSMAELELQAMASFGAGAFQGIARRPLDGPFLLDRVAGGTPMIYVTQQGRPRIAIFGDELELSSPLFVSAWSDRLMLVHDSEGEPVRLLYKDARTGGQTPHQVGRSITELIEFMAQRPTPEDPRPGLGFTYSEVVSALHAIHQAGGIDAEFATERDRLRTMLRQLTEEATVRDRPETDDDEGDFILLDRPMQGFDERDAERPEIIRLDPGTDDE